MPRLIKTIDQIMHERQADTYIISFNTAVAFIKKEQSEAYREHMAWFEANGLATETAAPRGWLSGDPGILAIYFDGGDDPRLFAYNRKFEDSDGGSLDPESYQMYLQPFDKWLEAGGEHYLSRSRNGDDLD